MRTGGQDQDGSDSGQCAHVDDLKESRVWLTDKKREKWERGNEGQAMTGRLKEESERQED